MASIAFMAPLLPDGAQRLKDLAAAVTGPKAAETMEFHHRLGLTAERWYVQSTPQGDVVIVYLEGDDVARAFQTLAGSQVPFDLWFKEQVKAVHGIDFSQPPQAPLPAQLYDWSAR